MFRKEIKPTIGKALIMHTFKSYLILFFLQSLLLLGLQAQPGKTTLQASNIKTLLTAINGKYEVFPVLDMDKSDVLTLSFDDMTHEYTRYTYRIEHCDADGIPSDELFESDYVRTDADEEVITDYEYSQNTTVLYTHYSLSIPNAHMRPLLPGNYRITVSRENDEGDMEPVIKTYFGVVSTKVGIYPSCSTDTEIDHNESHQQISLRIDASNLTLRDARSELKLFVLQNRRWDNAVLNPSYTAQNGDNLIWEHTRQLTFPAGNEYRKMEILSTRYPGMHGDGIRWIDPFYHYTLQQDTPRKNYLYDEDQDGLYLTRYEGGGDASTLADYVVTHFSLSMPRLDSGESIYVNGRWATTGLSNEYQMKYNEQTQAYEANLLLKCGYYNYMYLCKDVPAKNGSATAIVEGDYYQTENEYDFLVYYKPVGSRYWQLVGCITPIYRK